MHILPILKLLCNPFSFNSADWYNSYYSKAQLKKFVKWGEKCLLKDQNLAANFDRENKQDGEKCPSPLLFHPSLVLHHVQLYNCTGHEIPVDCILPLIPRLSYVQNAEALTHFMHLLRRYLF